MNTDIRKLPIDVVITQVDTCYPTLHSEFNQLLGRLDDLSINQRRLLTSYLRIQTSRINPTKVKK